MCFVFIKFYVNFLDDQHDLTFAHPRFKTVLISAEIVSYASLMGILLIVCRCLAYVEYLLLKRELVY